MKIVEMISAGAFALLFGVSASAQQMLAGSVARIDEANGKVTIQLSQSGTVGSGALAAEDFRIQDGLLFNALQPGDKVTFTFVDNDGIRTITKIQKQ